MSVEYSSSDPRIKPTGNATSIIMTIALNVNSIFDSSLYITRIARVRPGVLDTSAGSVKFV
jgi:hypothetical protein